MARAAIIPMDTMMNGSVIGELIRNMPIIENEDAADAIIPVRRALFSTSFDSGRLRRAKRTKRNGQMIDSLSMDKTVRE